jgi:hypothetical protein
VCVALVCLLPLGDALFAQSSAAQIGAPVGTSAAPTSTAPQQLRVQAIADDLKGRLNIVHPVQVSIVTSNRLLMSVEPVEGATPRAFELSVEGDFAGGLDDTELSAAIAHELGHVWIFTHHPFLQTEQLANEIAMRLVSRDLLAQLYDKVWKRGGTKGDLTRFLGLQTPAGLASSDAPSQ